jgi:hypothetical protein
MSKRIIKLKESDILKLVKRVLSEDQGNQKTSLVKLISFTCYKPGVIEITVDQCGTADAGCYTFIDATKGSNDWKPTLQEEKKYEYWKITCEDLKKDIVMNTTYQGIQYITKCRELAQYLLYKANCCGGNKIGGGDKNGGGDCAGKPGCGGGRVGGGDVPVAGCTTIRCKVESEIDKCTKKKYTWREVKKAFEEEFPAGAPSGSSERNQQLWKEWKKGWRPKCKDGSSTGGDKQGGGQTGGDRPIYAG